MQCALENELYFMTTEIANVFAATFDLSANEFS